MIAVILKQTFWSAVRISQAGSIDSIKMNPLKRLHWSGFLPLPMRKGAGIMGLMGDGDVLFTCFALYIIFLDRDEY